MSKTFNEQKPWSKIKGMNVHELDSETKQFHPIGAIPENVLWAFRHIINHDCGSLACGKTVYEVV